MVIVPRGIRNNNPGNIDFNPRNKWLGQTGIETGVAKPRFARFTDPVYGFRAAAILLLNYRGKDGMPGIGKDGIDTCIEIANRWAPPIENMTNSYGKVLANTVGVQPHQAILIGDERTLINLVRGINLAENGPNWKYDDEIKRAVAMALESRQ